MKKLLNKIYIAELEMRNALGNRFAYLLIILSIIGCYFLGYEIGKLVI